MDFMSVLIKLFELEYVLVKCELYFFPQPSFKTVSLFTVKLP